MDEQKLKDIQPPKKDGELTEKQKRRNTYIFTVIMLSLIHISEPTRPY